MRKIKEISTKQWLIMFFFLVIVAYSLFQARFIILGPHIEIKAPQNGASFEADLINVVGQAKNIVFISLNDRPIYVDKNGDWSEKLIAPKGPSIITVRARDRFGRSREKSVEIVVN